MAPSLREEFQPRKFLLQFSREDSFYTSQCKRSQLCIMLWRVFAAVYVLCWNTALNVLTSGRSLILLTLWTYMLLNIYFIVAAVVSICHFVDSYRKRKTNSSGQQIHENPSYEGDGSGGENGNIGAVTHGRNQVSGATRTEDGATQGVSQDKPLSLHLKVMWVLFNTVAVTALMVTILNYGLYGQYYVSLRFDSLAGAFDLNIHAINSVMILLEVFISAIPTRILHFYHPVIYALLYVLWSVIYWTMDKKNNIIYPVVLDWNSPGRTCGIVMAVLVGILLLQLLIYGLYRLRRKICKC